MIYQKILFLINDNQIFSLLQYIAFSRTAKSQIFQFEHPKCPKSGLKNCLFRLEMRYFRPKAVLVFFLINDNDNNSQSHLSFIIIKINQRGSRPLDTSCVPPRFMIFSSK